MNFLTDPVSIKSVDLRSSLNISPSTLSDIYKKLEINYVVKNPKSGAGKSISGTDARTILSTRGFNFSNNAKVISFSVCKGGSGKSTSTYYTAQRLAAYGAKVLIIDTDLQGNLTAAFKLEKFKIEINEETPILVDVFNNDYQISDIIIPYAENLHLIPSTPMNSRLESVLKEKHKNPSKPFKKILTPLKSKYDYILIDCAPAFNLTNTAIACASDTIILPANPDEFSKISLEQSINELKDIENEFNIKLNKRILFSKFDQREKVSIKYLSEIASEHEDKLFNTLIRTASDVKNAITKHENLFEYKKSKAKEDYDNLAKEILGLDQLFLKKDLH